MTEYWFARYVPANGTRRSGRGLIALNWKGRATIAAFILGLVLGGSMMLLFGLRDQMAIGIPLFVVCAIAGAGFFLWAGATKSDPTKSAYDYIKERRG